MSVNTPVEEKVPSLNELLAAIDDFKHGKITGNDLTKLAKHALEFSGKMNFEQKCMAVIALGEPGINASDALDFLFKSGEIFDSDMNDRIARDEILGAGVSQMLDKCYMAIWESFGEKYKSNKYSNEIIDLFEMFAQELSKNPEFENSPEIKDVIEDYKEYKKFKQDKLFLDSVRDRVLEIMGKMNPKYARAFVVKYETLGYDLDNKQEEKERQEWRLKFGKERVDKCRKTLDAVVDKGYLSRKSLMRLWEMFYHKDPDKIIKKTDEVQAYRDFVSNVRRHIRDFEEEPSLSNAKKLAQYIEKAQKELKERIEKGRNIEDFYHYMGSAMDWRSPTSRDPIIDFTYGSNNGLVWFDDIEPPYEYVRGPEFEAEFYSDLSNALENFIKELVNTGHIPEEVEKALWQGKKVVDKKELTNKFHNVVANIERVVAENDGFLKRRSLPKKLKPVLDEQPRVVVQETTR